MATYIVLSPLYLSSLQYFLVPCKQEIDPLTRHISVPSPPMVAEITYVSKYLLASRLTCRRPWWPREPPPL